MKKVIFALAAVVALAACSNEETTIKQSREAINFNDAFVENTTRAIDPSITTGTISSFKVYGTTQGDEKNANGDVIAPVVNIYKGVEVVKGATQGIGVDWKYANDNVQYWINGNTYNFAAVVNGVVATDDNGMPKTISYTASVNDDTDILYAVNNFGIYTKAEGTNPEVGFTFNHLLSKVKFTVNNTMTTNTEENIYQYTVENVKIVGAYAKGEYTVLTGVWNAYESDNEVVFGNVSNATLAADSHDAVKIGAVGATASATSDVERILIPGTFDATITATITTWLNDQKVDVTDYVKTVELTLAKGNAYNLVLNLGNPGDEILFTCTEVNGWDETNSNQTL